MAIPIRNPEPKGVDLSAGKDTLFYAQLRYAHQPSTSIRVRNEIDYPFHTLFVFQTKYGYDELASELMFLAEELQRLAADCRDRINEDS